MFGGRFRRRYFGEIGMNDVSYEVVHSSRRTIWNKSFGILNSSVRVMILDRVKWIVHGYVEAGLSRHISREIRKRIDDG